MTDLEITPALEEFDTQLKTYLPLFKQLQHQVIWKINIPRNYANRHDNDNEPRIDQLVLMDTVSQHGHGLLSGYLLVLATAESRAEDSRGIIDTRPDPETNCQMLYKIGIDRHGEWWVVQATYDPEQNSEITDISVSNTDLATILARTNCGLEELRASIIETLLGFASPLLETYTEIMEACQVLERFT